MSESSTPRVEQYSVVAYGLGIAIKQLQMLDAFLSRPSGLDWYSSDIRQAIGSLSGRARQFTAFLPEGVRSEYEQVSDRLDRSCGKLNQRLLSIGEYLDEESISMVSELGANADELKAAVRLLRQTRIEGSRLALCWFELGLQIADMGPNHQRAMPLGYGIIRITVEPEDRLESGKRQERGGSWLKWWVWNDQPRLVESLRELGVSPTDLLRDHSTQQPVELPIDKDEGTQPEFLLTLWSYLNEGHNWLTRLVREAAIRETSAAPGDPKRECYERDHYLLGLQLQAGKNASGKWVLGPGKLRDHWDGLTGAERQQISPCCFDQVRTDETSEGKRAGLSTVNTGLRKARKEREEETNSDAIE